LSKVIQERIDSLNLGNHVSLLGNVSENDLVKLYLQSDIFVLPCISLPDDVEGFGIVVLEAAISGTPIVATRTGGIPEAVIDGKTGLLVEPSDYNGMVQAISKLIKDNHFREYLAGEAKKRVNEQFCWDFILSEYFDVFYKMKEEYREN
jgi:glycosyltransferase involved in cell wall biosynthesis